jgi:hypothetical protein
MMEKVRSVVALTLEIRNHPNIQEYIEKLLENDNFCCPNYKEVRVTFCHVYILTYLAAGGTILLRVHI